MAKMDIDKLLEFAVRQEASDLLLKAGQPPILRVHGDLVRMKAEPMSADDTRETAYATLSSEQIKEFEEVRELDFAYHIEGLARFRCNLMLQRTRVSAVYRTIPLTVKSLSELGLPRICQRLADYPRGLVLVTGPTGSGKTTTLAAMIDHLNRNRNLHIVTVEDPIEYIHPTHRALINQRQVGDDTLSFANALKFVLRQAPDIILIGEMRDLESLQNAITAAETGHLVFGTLHTTDAVQTVDRVIDVFPTHQQMQVRMQLAVNLVGVLSQTLVKTVSLDGRVAAFESMEAVASIRSQIREGKTHQIASTIQTGSRLGMYSLNQSLANLVIAGVADPADARGKCTDPVEFDELIEEGTVREERAVDESETATAEAAEKARKEEFQRRLQQRGIGGGPS